MKKEFIGYLESIDIKERALLDRIESIYEFYLEMCPEEIADIFVTDYIDSEGRREYENLWFFSDMHVMEAKGFAAGKDDFDIAPIKDGVKYCEIRKQDYDFKEATGKSRLYLKISWATGISGEFKAAKENCDALRGIILKYVKKNLKG